MIFGRCQIAPATRPQVNIRPHTQVRSMHMRMRAVRMNQITQAETLAYPRTVFGEIVHVDSPGNGFDIVCGKGQMIEKPGFWHTTVGVGVRKPASVRRTRVAVEGRSGCDRSCLSDDTNLG